MRAGQAGQSRGQSRGQSPSASRSALISESGPYATQGALSACWATLSLASLQPFKEGVVVAGYKGTSELHQAQGRLIRRWGLVHGVCWTRRLARSLSLGPCETLCILPTKTFLGQVLFLSSCTLGSVEVTEGKVAQLNNLRRGNAQSQKGSKLSYQ